MPLKKFILICSALALFTFLTCISVFIWWFNATDNVGYVSPDFCTVRDELYQTISDKAQDWLKELSKSKDRVPTIQFSTPSGRDYIVSGEMLHEDDPYLYVTVLRTHLQIQMGTKGYMYMASDKPPKFDPTFRKLTYVGEKIYCYIWLKD